MERDQLALWTDASGASCEASRAVWAKVLAADKETVTQRLGALIARAVQEKELATEGAPDLTTNGGNTDA